MATLPELLKAVVDKNGSDLHIATDTPPQIRVHGELERLTLPVLTPAEFSYLRIDPVGPERIRLVARSFDLGGELTGLRDFRRDALDRTNQQDIAVVTRVQRGLRARGLPPGVHSSFLECRIGHFERMVTRALGAEVGTLARPGTMTYETRNGDSHEGAAATH